MNKTRYSKVPIRTLLATGLVTAMILGLGATLRSEEPKTDASAGKQARQSEAGKAGSQEIKSQPTSRKLSGAELYSMHCNRCHPERYPTERTAAQWKTILLHMRVRANLPAEQARTILKYLQDNSGR